MPRLGTLRQPIRTRRPARRERLRPWLWKCVACGVPCRASREGESWRCRASLGPCARVGWPVRTISFSLRRSRTRGLQGYASAQALFFFPSIFFPPPLSWIFPSFLDSEKRNLQREKRKGYLPSTNLQGSLARHALHALTHARPQRLYLCLKNVR